MYTCSTHAQAVQARAGYVNHYLQASPGQSNFKPDINTLNYSQPNLQVLVQTKSVCTLALHFVSQVKIAKFHMRQAHYCTAQLASFPCRLSASTFSFIRTHNNILFIQDLIMGTRLLHSLLVSQYKQQRKKKQFRNRTQWNGCCTTI